MTNQRNNQNNTQDNNEEIVMDRKNSEQQNQRIAADKIILGVASFIFISVTGWVGTSLNTLTTKVTELSIVVQYQKETQTEIYSANKTLIDSYTEIKVQMALMREQVARVREELDTEIRDRKPN